MTTNLAINGFGRIGRLVLRTLLAYYKKDLAVIAINDMADLKTNAHLFRYDSRNLSGDNRNERRHNDC